MGFVLKNQDTFLILIWILEVRVFKFGNLFSWFVMILCFILFFFQFTEHIVLGLFSDWNPHADLQAMARAHRLGQTNKVKVYSL